MLTSMHMLLAGKQSSIVTLEFSLATAYQVKHTLTIYPSNPTPRCLFKRKTYPYKRQFAIITYLLIIAPTGNDSMSSD